MAPSDGSSEPYGVPEEYAQDLSRAAFVEQYMAPGVPVLIQVCCTPCPGSAQVKCVQ